MPPVRPSLRLGIAGKGNKQTGEWMKERTQAG